MNRLLKSRKFLLAVIGSIFGVVAFILTQSETLSVLIISSFTAGVLGTALEDYASKSVPGGGIKPQEEEEEEEENGGN